MIIPQSSLPPIDFDGLKIFDYSAGRDWAASIAMIEVEPERKHPEARSKRSDKYYVVTGGEITFQLDGREHLLSRGDFCFVRCGQTFAYANRGSEPAILVLVHTPPFDIDDEEFIR